MLFEIFALVVVALLWGATNPFIKRGSKEISHIKADNAIKQFILEIKYILTNPKQILPMALNQLGSVVYFLTLQNVDLSLAIPVSNSLTFLFTALSGKILGEQSAGRNTYIGMALILIGTSCCCCDKYYLQKT